MYSINRDGMSLFARYLICLLNSTTAAAEAALRSDILDFVFRLLLSLFFLAYRCTHNADVQLYSKLSTCVRRKYEMDKL